MAIKLSKQYKTRPQELLDVEPSSEIRTLPGKTLAWMQRSALC